MSSQQPGEEPFEVDRAVQEALDHLTVIANASEALSSTLELEPGLRRLCRVLVPALADWCAIDLVEDDGRLRRAVVGHRASEPLPPGSFEALLPEAADTSVSSVARALRAAGPVRLGHFPDPADAKDALHRAELQTFAQLGAHSAVLVPLRARRRVLGVLTLVRTRPDGLDGTDRLPLIEDLAHRIAMTVDNARLHAQVTDTSERLQRALLPVLPATGPLEVAARYDPARAGAEIGGDWYDAFLLPDGALTLIVGDITGHDLNAAVTMSAMRNMLRGIACDRKEPPGRILARLDVAGGILYPSHTLTCLYALVTKPHPVGPWNLHYARAGHLPPLLVTADGDTRYLEGGHSLLMGVAPQTRRPDATDILPANSTVLLFTDGLIERRGEDLADGMTRLRQHAAALARAPLDDFCDVLMAELGQGGSDDIALIAVRIPPEVPVPYTATAD